MNNKRISQVLKKYVLLLIFFAVFQIFAYVIIFIIFSRFSQYEIINSFPFQTLSLIKSFFLILMSVLFIVLDFMILYWKIYKLFKIDKIAPIICTVDDMIITSYVSDHKRRYQINPIVKDHDGKLYFPYGKGNLSWYKTVYLQQGNYLSSIDIVKESGDYLNIGDEVDLYVLKSYNFKPEVAVHNLTVSIKNKPFEFQSVNNTNNLKFSNVELIEGAIDVK